MRVCYVSWRLVAIIMALAVSLSAQTWNWGAQIAGYTTGGYGANECEGIAVDANESIFVLGEFGDSAMIGGTKVKSTGAGADMFIAKMNSAGAFVWVKSFGSSFFLDQAIDLVTDVNGNVFVVGAISGTMDFGGVQVVGTVSSTVALAKYDGSGNAQWAKLVPNATSGPGGIVLSQDHLYVAVGRTLAKFNLAGDTVWTRTIPVSVNYSVQYYDIAADIWGCVELVGKMAGTVTYGTDVLSSVSTNDNDVLIVKYDPAGDVMWARRGGAISSPGQNDIAHSVATDTHGDVYVTGEYTGNAGFDTDSIAVGSAIWGMFLVKYSASGNVEWARGTSGGLGTLCRGFEVRALANDDALVATQFGLATTFGGSNFTTGGGSDVLLFRVAGDGTLRWGQRSNTFATVASAKGLAISAAGDAALVGGYFNTPITFGPNTLNIAGGFQDGFVARMTLSPLAVDELDLDAPLPTEYSLSQNYPNPFNPTTTIGFRLPRAARAFLAIYNTLGQRIRTLADQDLNAGAFAATWDGCDERGEAVASGVYLYQLRIDDYVETRKLTLLK